MLRNLIIITLLAFGSTAFAQDDITSLKVQGKAEYQGQNMVRLRALANQQLNAMGEDASDFELLGVTLEAKSRRGQGQATLLVGPDQQTKKVGRVHGSELAWVVTAPWSYQTIDWDLRAAPGQTNERWQMRFDGNIKVRSIVLHVGTSTTRVRIPMGDQLFTQDTLIRVKQQLNQMGYDVRRAELKKVILVAKSARGRGQARLITGQNMTAAQTIGQAINGFDFQSNAPRSYNRLRFDSIGNGQGRWQVEMRGRIKVKAIIVDFKN